MVYKAAKLDLSDKQIRQMVKGKPVRLGANQIGKGPHTILLHPENHAKLTKAHNSKKGVNLTIAPGEIRATHESDMSGTGFFSNLWDGIKSVGKQVLPVLGEIAQPFLGPLASRTLDVVTNKVIDPETYPNLNAAARNTANKVTGYGVVKRRAKISRKANMLMPDTTTGDSFRLN